LTADEVRRLVVELRERAEHPAAEAVADALQAVSASGTAALPLTGLENTALRHALEGIEAAFGELTTGLALLRQEVESDS